MSTWIKSSSKPTSVMALIGILCCKLLNTELLKKNKKKIDVYYIRWVNKVSLPSLPRQTCFIYCLRQAMPLVQPLILVLSTSAHSGLSQNRSTVLLCSHFLIYEGKKKKSCLVHRQAETLSGIPSLWQLHTLFQSSSACQIFPTHYVASQITHFCRRSGSFC